MRKIIGIIFISLMFANIGFADMRLIEAKKVKRRRYIKEANIFKNNALSKIKI